MERADLVFVTDKRQEQEHVDLGFLVGGSVGLCKTYRRKCRGRGSGMNKGVCVYSPENTKLDQLVSRRPWEGPDSCIGQVEGPCAGIQGILQIWSACVISVQALCLFSEHQAGLVGA